MPWPPGKSLGTLVVIACALGEVQPQSAARPSTIGQQPTRTADGVIWYAAGRARGTPAADDRTVYFLSRNHEVVALAAETGAVRWRSSTQEGGESTNGSSVTLAGSFLVAGDYNVIAFERTTGLLRWRFTPTDGYGPGIYLGSVTSDTVYTGSPAGRVFAIALESGAPRWSAVIGSDGKTTVFEPVADGEAIVATYTTFTVPNAGGIVSLDATTGRERWRAPFPAEGASLSTAAAGGPLIAGDVVVAVSATGAIYAFDRATGSIRWLLPPEPETRAASSDPTRPDFRALTRTGTVLVAASLTGHIVAYDLSTRSRRWSYTSALDGSAAFKITSDAATVYVPYFSGALLALNVEDGTLRWRRENRSAAFTFPPLPAGDRLFAASSDGFYCLRK